MDKDKTLELSQEEAFVLMNRYFPIDRRQKTVRDVADILECTWAHANRVEKEAINKIRGHALRGDPFFEALREKVREGQL